MARHDTTHNAQREEVIAFSKQQPRGRVKVLCFTPSSPAASLAEVALYRTWTYSCTYKPEIAE
jgi:hypothetical protein